ncbi:MAG: hypothetical protein QM530_04320 [Phycisphaerales bacterium]|nr:hypothetical protein [Phycisphaerales bacterium]
MKSTYRLIDNKEPSESQLKKIISAATLAVIKKAKKAEKVALKAQKEYLLLTQAKYSAQILAYAAKS